MMTYRPSLWELWVRSNLLASKSIFDNWYDSLLRIPSSWGILGRDVLEDLMLVDELLLNILFNILDQRLKINNYNLIIFISKFLDLTFRSEIGYTYGTNAFSQANYNLLLPQTFHNANTLKCLSLGWHGWTKHEQERH